MTARRRTPTPAGTRLQPQTAGATLTGSGNVDAAARPRGEQAMGAALYRRIREVVRRLGGNGETPPGD